MERLHFKAYVWEGEGKVIEGWIKGGENVTSLVRVTYQMIASRAAAPISCRGLLEENISNRAGYRPL